jgi:hypothetical protein
MYLDGYIYHMVHLNNLESILRRGALLSKERVQSENIHYGSIAEESVQGLRDRVYVWDSPSKRYRSLHSYVPFYFAGRTPMLYSRIQIQSDILFLSVSRAILKDPGVMFTDGNAANQQLSSSGTEVVYITAANSPDTRCGRLYSPDGPRGKNSNRSAFYSNVDCLGKLNWPVIISDQSGNDPERKRIKQAEALVPDLVPLSKIEGIHIFSSKRANSVHVLIKRYGLADRIPITVRPDLYARQS